MVAMGLGMFFWGELMGLCTGDWVHGFWRWVDVSREIIVFVRFFIFSLCIFIRRYI